MYKGRVSLTEDIDSEKDVLVESKGPYIVLEVERAASMRLVRFEREP